MSKLQELINRLCPKGVEFKPLAKLMKSYSSGSFTASIAYVF